MGSPCIPLKCLKYNVRWCLISSIVCPENDQRVRLERYSTAPLMAERIANVPASMVWNKGPPPRRCRRCCTASAPKTRIPPIEASIRIRLRIIFISIQHFSASYKDKVNASISC